MGFLQSNALTKVPDLSRFTELKGIYLENNAIGGVESDTFAANTKLEVMILNNNFITELPADLLASNTVLKSFQVAFNYIKSLPVMLFSTTPKLELMSLVDNRLTGFELGTFDDLVSLQYLNTFINNISVLKSSLFGSWSAKLEVLIIFLYQTTPVPPLVIEDGVFDKLPSLIDIASYTSGNIINPTDVANNPSIKTVLYGSQFDILAPLPEPALVNEALL